MFVSPSRVTYSGGPRSSSSRVALRETKNQALVEPSLNFRGLRRNLHHPSLSLPRNQEKAHTARRHPSKASRQAARKPDRSEGSAGLERRFLQQYKRQHVRTQHAREGRKKLQTPPPFFLSVYPFASPPSLQPLRSFFRRGREGEELYRCAQPPSPPPLFLRDVQSQVGGGGAKVSLRSIAAVLATSNWHP